MTKRLIIAGLLASIVAACGGGSDSTDTTTPTTASSTTAPTATTTDPTTAQNSGGADVEAPGPRWELQAGEGFAVYAPDTWASGRQLLVDEDLRSDFGDEMSRLGLADEDIGAFLDNAAMLLLDFGSATEEFVDNLNVLTTPVEPGLTLEILRAANLAEIEVYGFEIIGTGRVDHEHMGESLYIDYQLPDGVAEGKPMYGRQYLLLDATQAYILSFSGSRGSGNEIWAQIAATFHATEETP